MLNYHSWTDATEHTAERWCEVHIGRLALYVFALWCTNGKPFAPAGPLLDFTHYRGDGGLEVSLLRRWHVGLGVTRAA